MAILVVDDSRAMRMIVRRELRKAGYDEVVEADNGAVALQTLKGGGVELVLSDWNMPDMNGIELLTALRSEDNAVAFGFVTSEAGDDIRLRAFEVGADFVVTKPFTGDELSMHVAQALRGERGSQTATTASPPTVAGVLEGLLGRKVTTTDSPPPRTDATTAVATYATTDGSAHSSCVFEMPLAASVGCALALVPASQAEEWGSAHALSEAIEANFYEVANVLAKLGSPSNERLVLQGVSVITGDETIPGVDPSSLWWSTVEVHVDGYPSGRLGFTAT